MLADKIYKNYKTFFLLIIAILFGDTFFYGYTNDDYALVNFKFSYLFRESSYEANFRPLWWISYSITNLFFHSSHFDHLINLILFFINLNLAFYWLNNKFGKKIAIYSLLIWITIPWQTHQISWISQRNDLLMNFFFFLSLIYLEKKNYNLSIFHSFLAFLSKVTCLFFPLLFCFKGILEKKKKLIFFGFFIFVLSFLLSLYSWNIGHPEADYLKNSSLLLKILNFIKNWILTWPLIFFPVPFFVNFFHFSLYFFFIIFFVSSVKLKKINIKEKEILYILLIIFLLSLTTVMSYQLRIVALETLFIIVFAFMIIKINKKFFFLISMAFFITFNLIAIHNTKKLFKTDIYLNDGSASNTLVMLYPNDYYDFQKKIFIKLKKKLKLK